jgi:hypothetical protein
VADLMKQPMATTGVDFVNLFWPEFSAEASICKYLFDRNVMKFYLFQLYENPDKSSG